MTQAIPDNRWHMNKSVNLTHILTTLTLAAALFVWGGKLETRIALVEQAQSHQTQGLEEIKGYLKEIRQDMKELQRSIDDSR